MFHLASHLHPEDEYQARKRGRPPELKSKELAAENHPDQPNPKYVLATLHNGAKSSLANAQKNKTVELLERAVAIQTTSFAEDHPQRLESEHKLARAYLANDQINKAVNVLEHVVATQTTSVATQTTLAAEDYPDLLALQCELGTAYLQNGQIDEALKLLEQTAAIQAILVAKNHPVRLTSQHELARAYLADRRVAEAVRLLKHVVTVRSTLSEDHPRRLESEHELGTAYLADGQVAEAIKLLEHVVTVQSTLLEDHPRRLASEHMLATAYFADGQVAEAKKLMEYVITVRSASAEYQPLRLDSEQELTMAYHELTKAYCPGGQGAEDDRSQLISEKEWKQDHSTVFEFTFFPIDASINVSDSSILSRPISVREELQGSPSKSAAPGKPRSDGSEVRSESDSSSCVDQVPEWEYSESILAAKKSETAERLLQLYLSQVADDVGAVEHAIRSHACESGTRSSSGTIQGQSLPSDPNLTSSSGKLGKRPREGNDDDEDERRQRRRCAKLNEPSDPNGEIQLLACPFYKKDRHRYRPCGRSVLRNISRVKQHLLRYHKPQIHCDRCSMTFTTEAERVEHMRMAAPCLLKPPVRWDGVTEEQQRELSKRTSSKRSARENWYHIYGILFPGENGPDSPYLEGLESQELRRILAFAETEGPDIVDDLMADLPDYQRVQPEDFTAYMNSATQEFINLLFERWESVGRRNATSVTQAPSSPERQHIVPASNCESISSGSQEVQNFSAPSVAPLLSISFNDILDDPNSSQLGNLSTLQDMNPNFESDITHNHSTDVPTSPMAWNAHEWLEVANFT